MAVYPAVVSELHDWFAMKFRKYKYPEFCMKNNSRNVCGSGNAYFRNDMSANERSWGPESLVSLPSDEAGYKYKYEICNVQILRGSVLPDGPGFELMF
jgi:hypothetical protein